MNQQLSNLSDNLESFKNQNRWQKILIWGGLLLLLYVLREFFLIGFLTFLFCFIVRSLVGWISRRISVVRDDQANDLIITISTFLVILLVFFGLGQLFLPKVMLQGKSLLAQMKALDAAEVQNALLARTAGAWQFNRQFGDPSDARYQKAFLEYQNSGQSGEGLYRLFPSLHARLQSEFEAKYEEAQLVHLRSRGTRELDSQMDLEQWFMVMKAPEIFENRGDYYRNQWNAEYASSEKAQQFEQLRQQPDFEARRDDEIRRRMWIDMRSDPVLYAELTDEWSKDVAIRLWNQFRQSTDYEQAFEEFYETEARQTPETIPLEYSFYRSLKDAYPKGKQAFLEAVRQHSTGEQQSEVHRQLDFESAKKLEFGQRWWANSHFAAMLREHAESDESLVLGAIVNWFDNRLGDVFRLPLQILTALLLSIFLLVEWHGIKRRVEALRETRLRTIYDEISPGVIAFGKLIGRSFQGQVIIAFLNASLTLAAMWWIGVDYKFVLCLVVFLFSFIPVLGVVLSGLPICVIAMLQPDGSIGMVLKVVVAIVVIHLAESMLLAPRIVGKIGHLHPVLVIVILLVAEKFFGMWGLVLGMPVAIYLIRVVILDVPIVGIYEPKASSDAEHVLTGAE